MIPMHPGVWFLEMTFPETTFLEATFLEATLAEERFLEERSLEERFSEESLMEMSFPEERFLVLARGSTILIKLMVGTAICAKAKEGVTKTTINLSGSCAI